MTDPLLSSLCLICHTNPPKYRCPRCSSQTCSLACTKRHKLWSDCSGIRDPTVYKPKSELATPAGIDHDYNFISAIERSIERTERVIVEDRALLNRKELRHGNDEGNPRYRWRGHQPGAPDLHHPLGKAMYATGVRVDRAPKGMQRNVDNMTNWSKPEKCINWTVEWIREDGTKVIGKAMDKYSIGRVYGRVMDAEITNAMTPAQKRLTKKRKAEEIEEAKAKKRAKLDQSRNLVVEPREFLQDPRTSAWNIEMEHAENDAVIPSRGTFSDNPAVEDTVSKLHFYLHRPYTPSGHQKVLIPLPPLDTLRTLLRDRVVQEFPTIFVLLSPPDSLPDQFILEEQYLADGTQTMPMDVDVDKDSTDDSSDEDEGEQSATSSSGDSDADSDSEMEEGEI